MGVSSGKLRRVRNHTIFSILYLTSIEIIFTIYNFIYIAKAIEPN